MTSFERMQGMFIATEYIVENDIKGSIVECGVWKGGSMMVSALTLMKKKDTSRKFYLYDTFEGMSKPTVMDYRVGDFNNKKSALKKWKENTKGEYAKWSVVGVDTVKSNIKLTGYPMAKMNFIKGKVEDTLPNKKQPKIALLRLDTDWYESTYHELKTLYPLLVKGGLLIIDDYGYWKGCKEAVDKYFLENNIKIYLHKIDYSGRIAVKP